MHANLKQLIISGILLLGTQVAHARHQIYDAAQRGDVGEVNALLKENPGLVHNRDGKGFTPLHVAAQYNKADVAKFLLDSGAAVNATTTEKGDSGYKLKRTPLHLAAGSGALEAARVLIARKADVGAYSKFTKDGDRPYLAYGGSNDTPLHSAARGNRLGVAQLLIGSGADVNASYEQGTRDQKITRTATPLYVAADAGLLEMVTLLVGAGAEPNINSAWLGMFNRPLEAAKRGVRWAKKKKDTARVQRYKAVVDYLRPRTGLRGRLRKS